MRRQTGRLSMSSLAKDYLIEVSGPSFGHWDETKPRVYGVPVEAFSRIYDEVIPLIVKALKHSDGKYSIEDIVRIINSRDGQLWVACYEDSKVTTMMVTQVITYPQERRLLILLYAGQGVASTGYFLPVIYEGARKLGCTAVEIYGRPGWERVMEREGFKKVHTVLSKKL